MSSQTHEEFEPRGTWVIVLIFVALLVVIWGSIYWMLLQYGPTV
jgi:hypothetical protein